MTGVNYSEQVPALGKRLGAGISYFILSLLGTMANLLVAYAMYKHRSFFLRYPFYVMACHLLVASLGVLLGQFVVVIPLSLAGKPLYGEGDLMIALASFDTLFFLTIFFISFLISVNRFCATFSRKMHWFLFEDWRLHITCCIPWLLGLFWTIYTTVIGCPKVFRHDVFYYTYRCPDPMTTNYQKVFMTITQDLGLIGPAIIMLFYIIIIIYIRIGKPASQSYSSEINILIQALLICSAFELETLLFTFLPKLTPDWGIFAVSLLLDYALIFNASVNPIIMIVMNPKIKSAIHTLMCGRTVIQSDYVFSDQRVFEVSTTDMRKVYSLNEEKNGSESNMKF